MLSAIFICWINLIIAVYKVQGSTFRERAIATIELVDNRLKIEKCTQAAAEKASTFYPATDDRHYAVLWISMYSRWCLIPDSVLQDDKENEFPLRLNKELRCRYVNKKDKSLTNIFIEVGTIIEESLLMFSPIKHTKLYRTVKSWPFTDQTFFVEEGFYSVSKLVSPSLNFGKLSEKLYLFIVDGYTGVEIKDYVQVNYTYQDEVLGKMGKEFKIDKNVTDITKIKGIMSTFSLDHKHKNTTPTTIFYISQTSVDNKEQILQEQRQKLGPYCTLSETSGQFQVKCKCYVILIHFCILVYSKLLF